MKFSSQAIQTAALGLLVGSSSAFGIARSKYLRDLELARLYGLDPDAVLNDPGKTRANFLSSSDDGKPKGEFTEIPLDHHDKKSKKYKNRFFVDETEYKPGGPVFIFDCGEGDCQNYADFYLVNETSFFKQMVKEWHGIGVAWEHRYYGQSLPVPVDVDTKAKDLKYLNTEQALADLPYFAKSFKRKAFPDQDLTPKSTPWIIVGGSYPGMRAAFSRDQYPETFHAAFASSAPVQAQVDMSAYYQQAYRGLVAYGYENCTKDVHAAYTYIDRQLKNKKTAADIKELFLGKEARDATNGDFTAAIGTVFWDWQSAGPGTGETGAGHFCDWLETDPITGSKATKEGFAHKKGAKALAERYAAYKPLAKLANANFNTNCRGTDKSKPTECDLGKRYSDPAMISWSWQYCTEWGYYQTKNWEPHNLLSKYQTLEYQQHVCNRQFPDGVKSGDLPRRPKTVQTNRKNKGWHMRPSNTYFSAGQYDPWTTLSVLSTEHFAPHGIEVSSEIPACGKSTGRKKIFGTVIPNAQHCYDFRTYFKGGDASRKLFRDALKKWIPCFKKSD